MALLLTLQPDSPILLNSNTQRLEFYINIAGSHFIKQSNVYTIAVKYYTDQTSATAAPDANALSITGLPRLVPVMRPLDVLATTDNTAYSVMYGVLTTYLLSVCGEGTTIVNV